MARANWGVGPGRKKPPLDARQGAQTKDEDGTRGWKWGRQRQRTLEMDRKGLDYHGALGSW